MHYYFRMETFLVVVFIYGLHLILFNVLLFSSPHIDIIAKILLECEIFIFCPSVLRITSIKLEVDKSFFQSFLSVISIWED